MKEGELSHKSFQIFAFYIRLDAYYISQYLGHKIFPKDDNLLIKELDATGIGGEMHFRDFCL